MEKCLGITLDKICFFKQIILTHPFLLMRVKGRKGSVTHTSGAYSCPTSLLHGLLSLKLLVGQ